ncbi:hypothetical protein EX30DRAFT_393294 [Ascodesmis nigricans]|uniref:Uncharacterized protein n=1 Tax=Ascodesmis nigricans TaxID=341454 RepID=A0A4S2N3G6_9PEZI|nr:hypothetical protein EX30DRAFT_393294 [Ascodesmis nigricans]
MFTSFQTLAVEISTMIMDSLDVQSQGALTRTCRYARSFLESRLYRHAVITDPGLYLWRAVDLAEYYKSGVRAYKSGGINDFQAQRNPRKVDCGLLAQKILNWSSVAEMIDVLGTIIHMYGCCRYHEQPRVRLEPDYSEPWHEPSSKRVLAMVKILLESMVASPHFPEVIGKGGSLFIHRAVDSHIGHVLLGYGFTIPERFVHRRWSISLVYLLSIGDIQWMSTIVSSTRGISSDFLFRLVNRRENLIHFKLPLCHDTCEVHYLHARLSFRSAQVRLRFAQILVSRGLDINVRQRIGLHHRSLLSYSRSEGDEAMASWLEAKGARLTPGDIIGDTPMYDFSWNYLG